MISHQRTPKEASSLLLDRQFNESFANQMARLEAYNKHLYRPNSYLHKWWARRCGSTFRLLLKHLVPAAAQRDYYMPGGLQGITILDPMMGGGTTLHEAIRLGANVIGADIDPIPVLQARATLSEIPLADLEDAFANLLRQLRAENAPLFQTHCPFCAEPVEMRYMLYGLHAFQEGEAAVVVDSLTLRHNSDGSKIRIDPESYDIYRDKQLISRAVVQKRPPLIAKKPRARVHKHQEDLTVPYYRRYWPLAIVGKCAAHKLFFKAPDVDDLALLAQANERRAGLSFDPDDFRIVAGPKSSSLALKRGRSYLDFFSSRQLLVMQTAVTHLPGYAPLLRLNLGLLLSTSLEFNAMLCGYKGGARSRPGTIRHAFSHHAYAFPHTALENNPIYSRRASGSLQNLFVSRIVRGRTWAMAPVERAFSKGQVQKQVIATEIDAGQEVQHPHELQAGQRRFLLRQGSSARLDLPDGLVDYIVTDPPYYDSVQYSDLAAYFHVWLRQLLPDAANWADAFTADSAVAHSELDAAHYRTLLTEIFTECRRVLKPDNGRLIFTFHHRHPQSWVDLTLALQQAGFVLVNRYVVRAENPASVHIANRNALLHDVILVLAAADVAPDISWLPVTAVCHDDSEAFCRDCGAIVGWLLQAPHDETAITETWYRLLHVV